MPANWFWISIVIPIVLACATSLLTYFFTIRKAKFDLGQEYNKKFNMNRWEVYLEFIKIISDLIHYDLINRTHDVEDTFKTDDTTKKLLEIEQSILLMGSLQLIENFGKWKICVHMNGSNDPSTLQSLTAVVNAMRIDLGEKGILNQKQVLDILHPGWQRTL